MNKKERIWWEELADQYEVWADEPPRSDTNQELYTCNVLWAPDWGFLSYPGLSLERIWVHIFRPEFPDFPDYPAGGIFNPERPERREKFCWWMAETIRDYLETGKGPWETE